MANLYDYLEAERRIFPLWTIQPDGSCACGEPECSAVGKHPRISSWNHSPHWSDEQIEAMTDSGQLDTGFGVCIDDQLIIDVDPRNGGNKGYAKLCKDTGLDFEALSGHVVATGGGGKHIEFSRPAEKSLVQTLDAYPGIDFKSSGFVVGASSIHRSGAAYETEKGNPGDLTPAPDALLALLQRKDYHRGRVSGEHVDVSLEELAAIVDAVPNNDAHYDDYISIGMGIHHTTGGAADGFDLWCQWAEKSSKYNPRSMDKKWHSFGKAPNPITLGTLIAKAEANGYQRPVTFPVAEVEAPTPDGHPFPVDTVDLLRPPGFVGKVTDWINSQSRFPRERLAVAAALTCVGNIIGLRMMDDKDGVTANLFMFCVSASATGKEAVLQAATEIHRAAGINLAAHGSIKSEQEITRNLVRHQAAYYLIDELGYLLRKITNAQEKGGAAYLDGIIGMLMSAYSKASGYLLLTGDMKEEVRATFAREYAQCRKAVHENEDPTGAMARRIEELEVSLEMIDTGLERPFLSMMGFTTPVTFDELVTAEQATNGFIGRAIIVRERETNPKRKRGFRKRPMPSSLRAALQNLHKPGEYDSAKGGRVENYSAPSEIPTEAKAEEMLEQVADWVEEYAEEHKGKTGLEAIVRRAYEQVSKLSLVMAGPEGVRTPEHVRWAYRFVRQDIDEKIMLAHSNSLEKRTDASSQGEALMARIASLVDDRDGETLGVIANRCRKWAREDVEKALDHLERAGQVVRREVPHARNGKPVVKYYRPDV